MRIIAGNFKGHKLVSFDEDHIRPMTDRVKESLFNIWSAYLESARILDLYSGTGSIGLEALSRGAKSVDFVESHGRSISLIVKNIEILKVKSQTQINRSDAIKFLDHFEGEPFDLVFIDPPFPSQICQKTLEALERSRAIKMDTRIVIEHSRHEKLDSQIGKLRAVDTRAYGDKILTFYGFD